MNTTTQRGSFRAVLLSPASYLLTSAVVLCLLSPAAQAAYSYSRSITLSASSAVIPATQTNFTVKLCVNSSGSCNYGTVSGLNQSGGGAHVLNANGYDIVFTSDAGCTTLLNWEVEHYVASTGELVAHVLFTSLALSTVIYMCYGNASISSFQGRATGAAWDAATVGMWHFPNGSSLSVNDSTSNGNNGTSTGSPTATGGQIDGAIALSGSGQYVDFGQGSSLIGNTSITVSAWINAAALTPAYSSIVEKYNAVAHGDNQELLVRSDGKLAVYLGTSGGGATIDPGTSALSTGTWYFIAYSYDSVNGIQAYINGAPDSTAAANGTLESTTPHADTYISHDQITAGREFDGSMDEVRISNSSRSANWILIEYNNVNAPTSFYTVSSEGAPGVVQTFDPTVFSCMVFATGPTCATAYTELFTENLVIVESASPRGAHFSSPSERLQITDSGFRIGAHFAAPADSTAIAELLIGSAGHSVSFSDRVGVTEAQSFRNGKGVLVRDQLQAADLVSGHGAHFTAPADQLQIADITSRSGSHFSSASESSLPTDAAVRLGAHFAVPSEAEGLLDSAARHGAHFAAASDQFGIRDSESRSAGLHASASDASGVFESICTNCTGNHFLVAVFEYSGSADSLGMRQALSRLTVDMAAAADRPGLALIRPSKQGTVPEAVQSGNVPELNTQGAAPAANENGGVPPALLNGNVPATAQRGGVAP